MKKEDGDHIIDVFIRKNVLIQKQVPQLRRPKSGLGPIRLQMEKNSMDHGRKQKCHQGGIRIDK